MGNTDGKRFQLIRRFKDWLKHSHEDLVAPPYSEAEINAIRDRKSREGALLRERTGIVLVFNGLMAAAAGLTAKSKAAYGLAGVVVVFDFLWLYCAITHYRYSGLLGRILKHSPHKRVDDELRFKFQGEEQWYTLTTFFCLFLPVLLIVGWAAWFVFSVSGPAPAGAPGA